MLLMHKAAFFFKLERELEKINAYYLQREAELKMRLSTLISKRKRIQQSSAGHLTRQSSSFVALYEGLRHFQSDLGKLQSFIEIKCAPKLSRAVRNCDAWLTSDLASRSATGFRKILKKWDKRSKSATKELYLSRQVEVQPCFNRIFVTELSDAASANVAKLETLADAQGSSMGDANDPAADVVPTTDHANQADEASGCIRQQQQQQHQDPSRMTPSVEAPDSVQGLEDLEAALSTAIKSGDADSVSALLATLPKDPFVSNAQPEVASQIQRILWKCINQAPAQTQSLIPIALFDFTYADDINGRTCLHTAVQHDREDLVRLALAHNAPLTAVDAYGRQALHYAAMQGYSGIVDILMRASLSTVEAASTSKDMDGKTPVIYAVSNGHVATVNVFIRAGVRFDQQLSTSPEDPLPLSLACQNGHVDVVELLLNFGAPIKADTAGFFPQHLAAREGHDGCLKLLSSFIAAHPKSATSMDEPDKYSVWTPLFHAASEGHNTCVQVLLDAGASVDAQDENQNTPVHYAAWRGHIDCLNLLLSARARQLKATEVELDATGPPRSSMSPEEVMTDEFGGDDVPDLSLPPPIIPFRVYGHNYLDNKVLVQLTLSHPNSTHHRAPTPPVRLYGQDQLQLKLVIAARSSSDNSAMAMPHNILLPLEDERDTFTFQVDATDLFSLDFDVYPAFGTRILGKATSLPSMFSSLRSLTPFTLPVLDSSLKAIGELDFEVCLVKPFDRAALAPGGHLQTYWKSSTPASTNPSQSSVVTGSSLTGEHIRVIVQVTKDGFPVAYPQWKIQLPSPNESLDVFVGDLTLQQFTLLSGKMGKNMHLNGDTGSLDARGWHSAISQSMVTLSQVLQVSFKFRSFRIA